MALIEWTFENSVLSIILSRPEAHNALNGELIRELSAVFKGTSKMKDLRVVVLRGAGSSFCAGGDLNWMRSSLNYSYKQNLADVKKLSDMFEAIYRCPVPVLADIHGNVMGGGVGLAAVCDIVVADHDTKFCLSEVKLGLVPSVISPYVLRKIPFTHARRLMLTAEIFKADEAQAIGLVHYLGTTEERRTYIENRVQMISSNGPEAVRITKTLSEKVPLLNWSKARILTQQTIARRRISDEGQEGMNAFFEKRRPKWQRKNE